MADANKANLRRCYAKEGVLAEAWSVTVRLTFGRDGGRGYAFRTTKDGVVDKSPVAQALEDCHAGTMNQWPWPSPDGIEGTDGGRAYLVVLSGLKR